MIKEVMLIKMGEIVLKGLNKRDFEDALIRAVKRRVSDLGKFRIRCAQSIVYVEPQDDEFDMDQAVERVGKIFGIARISRAGQSEKTLGDIKICACEYLEESLQSADSFKVECKRSDKSFELNSPQISAMLGETILQNFKNLRVDVHNPDITVTVEVRDFGAYVHAQSLPGAGGIPVGMGGKAGVMISGGIDSPVAAWMMAKRGLGLTGIHFASPPYTSARAEQKVTELMERVARYCGPMDMLVVPFTRIQEDIKKHCREELFTIIMRRFMMKIADAIARDRDLSALITGESLGQVASQTMSAIACTDAATDLPVFRPLIGMDKEEIVSIARKIDTFEVSIMPYEDCCTIFTPAHPKIRPKLRYVEHEESRLDVQSLVSEAVCKAKLVKIMQEPII